MTQEIKTSGTTWVVPADWNNSDNTIECIGAGGTGKPGEGTGGAAPAGGGGAYAKITNATLTPGATIDIQVGSVGTLGISQPTPSWVKNAVGGTIIVQAINGSHGATSSGPGGTAAASTGDVKYSGGDGGAGGTRSGPGGGGAGGPTGAGKNGAAGLGGTAAGGGGGGGSNGGSSTAGVAATNQNGGNGGANDAGSGGGTGATSSVAGGNGTDGGGGGGGYMNTGTNVGSAGGNGVADPVWGAGYGPSGGGGGGAGNNVAGIVCGAGGTASYGGGGGAGGAAVGGGTDGAGGVGGPGIIVFTYTPAGGDTTAPVLTSPTGTQTGSTTATVGATTDEANGTLYGFISTSATPPSDADLKAGTGAVWSGSATVSSTGANTLNATGLTASTGYYAHLLHTDAATNDSNTVTSAQFTTASGATAISKIIQQIGL